jgi:hypothetical protein
MSYDTVDDASITKIKIISFKNAYLTHLPHCKMFFTESAARGLIDVIDVVIDHHACM